MDFWILIKGFLYYALKHSYLILLYLILDYLAKLFFLLF